MSDQNVGTQAQLEHNSLKHYNATGVINAHTKFKNAALEFERLSNDIDSTKRSLESCWDGPAHNEFQDRYNKVFSKVRDICDNLNTIQEMLNEAQLAFYEADDDLDQKMKQAAHNSKGGSSPQGKKDTNTYEPNCSDPYTPTLVNEPMPAKPVLVSTMGEAYEPNLSDELFSQKPELHSTMASAVMAILTYNSLAAKDIIAHNVADALQVVLDSTVFPRVADLYSTMGDAYIPNLDDSLFNNAADLHSTMGEDHDPVLDRSRFGNAADLHSTIGAHHDAVLDESRFGNVADLHSTTGAQETPGLDDSRFSGQGDLVSTIGSPYTPTLDNSRMGKKAELTSTFGSLYFPGYYYASIDHKVILNNLLTTAVISSVTDSLVNNYTKDQLIASLGEAALQHLTGEYPPEMRDILVRQIGTAIYEQLYGKEAMAAGQTGFAAMNAQPDWPDSLGKLIDGAVNQSYHEWGATSSPVSGDNVTMLPTASGATSVLFTSEANYFGGVLPASSIASFQGFGDLNASQAAVIAGKSADYSNGTAINTMILGSVEKQLGVDINASSVLFGTSQTATSNLTLTFGAPTEGFASMNAFLRMDAQGVALHMDPITNSAAKFSALSTTPDFSGIQFPVAHAG